MARKEQFIIIAEDNRDKDRTYKLTEMDSLRASHWATLALLKMLEAGFDIPDGAQGMEGLARAIASAATTAPTLQTLLRVQLIMYDAGLADWIKCVKYAPPGLMPQDIFTGAQAALCQIEEPSTWTKLFWATYELHAGFFSPGSPSPTAPASSLQPPQRPVYSPTRMSRRKSAMSPPQDSPPITS